MSKLKHKIKTNAGCLSGAHTFVPTSFKIGGNYKTCTVMTCQHCLMTVDKSEQECLALECNQEAEKSFIAELEKPKRKSRAKVVDVDDLITKTPAELPPTE